MPAASGSESPHTAIPDKLFFRIGEVSQMIGVEPYVLRYWETEFRGLSPKKSSSGQRMFRRKDVELLFRIRHLLYERKFTIEGARKALLSDAPNDVSAMETGQQALSQTPDALPDIRKELASILELLR
ncbi:MAG TPA: MerR family transcriptional regulator [Bryobacteraceae bacterium]|nr:MerR family transcriptional regulator [Bryobacteraceae bacterium]